MTAPHSPSDLLWRLACGLMLMNLLNMVLWAMGWYAHPALYAALAALTLVFSWRPPRNGLSVVLLIGALAAIALSAPITDWDARSIWFFHAKRIFFDNNLYAQLDNYAGWSHNDYPLLVPALAASLAKSVGHWNEVFPRLSVVMVLLPAILALGWAMASRAAFNLMATALLLMGDRLLLNGYMDAVLALYCACACVLLSRMWERHLGPSTTEDDPQDCVLWVLVVSNIIFLKNEGLLAALLLWVCALPALWGRWKWLAWSLAPFVLYAVLWRMPLHLHHIQGDLFVPGILERGWGRVRDPAGIQAIAGAVLKHSGLYGVALLGAMAWAFRRAQLLRAWPVFAFAALYTLAIVTVYLITPNDLTWHLATSIDRTMLTANLCVVAGVLQLAARRA